MSTSMLMAMMQGMHATGLWEDEDEDEEEAEEEEEEEEEEEQQQAKRRRRRGRRIWRRSLTRCGWRR